MVRAMCSALDAEPRERLRNAIGRRVRVRIKSGAQTAFRHPELVSVTIGIRAKGIDNLKHIQDGENN